MNQIPNTDGRWPILDEELVSYLDGELDAQEASRIEEALAANPQVRDQLRQLERSWQLLDELPRTHVDESFTRTTVEMIAVKAEEDLHAIQSELPRRQRRLTVAVVGGLLAAGVVGFAAVAMIAHQADENLLRDLPVIENLDQYREVEDLEFLRMLQARGFGENEANHDR